jgi:hypothetical protein
MKIEENVNPGMGKRRSLKIPFEKRKNVGLLKVRSHSRKLSLAGFWPMGRRMTVSLLLPEWKHIAEIDILRLSCFVKIFRGIRQINPNQAL